LYSPDPILFLYNHSAPSEFYTLSLHDALPISVLRFRQDSFRADPRLPAAILDRAWRPFAHGFAHKGFRVGVLSQSSPLANPRAACARCAAVRRAASASAGKPQSLESAFVRRPGQSFAPREDRASSTCDEDGRRHARRCWHAVARAILGSAVGLRQGHPAARADTILSPR